MKNIIHDAPSPFHGLQCEQLQTFHQLVTRLNNCVYNYP